MDQSPHSLPKSQRKIAKELGAKIGNNNIQSVTVFLNQIFSGKRSLPANYFKPLLEILDIDTAQELKARYPKIRFAGETGDEDRHVVEISASVVNSIRELTRAEISELLGYTHRLKKLGIDIDIKVKPS